MSRPQLSWLFLWLVIGWASVANAEWTQRSSRREPSVVAGVVHHSLLMENTAAGDDATLELTTFSPKSAQLWLIDNSQSQDLATTVSGGDYIAAVNGGYFDEEFKPLGLRINNGKILSPLLRARLLTGIVVSSGANIRIVRVAEFSKSSRPAMAIQCGPFLIDGGHEVSRLDATRRARRTFVAVTIKNHGMLGFCSGASLAQLSAILSNLTGDLKIQRALNLDGGSSSAFWFKRKDGTAASISEQKNVRDFIALAPQ